MHDLATGVTQLTWGRLSAAGYSSEDAEGTRQEGQSRQLGFPNASVFSVTYENAAWPPGCFGVLGTTAKVKINICLLQKL